MLAKTKITIFKTRSGFPKKAAVLLCVALGDISDAFISQTCLSLCLNLTWPNLHDQKWSQGLINTDDLQENLTRIFIVFEIRVHLERSPN